ncbi:hypothetical protein MTR_4g045907 [Medicago truncatula]|uniref:Uncharacterized protein n=1 Tax=Medicago truncatula TaxID=3880 RepID=G7ZX76_MEDTR|nr:hypothetical protein MTR_4g045907 [Medicago truncatula]
MSGPPGSPRDPIVVSELWFDERFRLTPCVESLLDKECKRPVSLSAATAVHV